MADRMVRPLVVATAAAIALFALPMGCLVSFDPATTADGGALVYGGPNGSASDAGLAGQDGGNDFVDDYDGGDGGDDFDDGYDAGDGGDDFDDGDDAGDGGDDGGFDDGGFGDGGFGDGGDDFDAGF